MSDARLGGGMSRRMKLLLYLNRLAILVLHVVLVLSSGVSAFLLRFDLTVPDSYLPHLRAALSLWLLTKIPILELFGLSRRLWRYVSILDIAWIGLANLLGSILGTIGILLFAPRGFPRSIYALDFLLCFLLTLGARVAVRMITEIGVRVNQGGSGKLAFIYGAGSAGQAILREIRSNPRVGYSVCGFIDDNPKLVGSSIYGVPVVGSMSDLKKQIERHAVQEVLIAIPSATGPQMTAIVQACRTAGAVCKTVPGLAEVIEQGGLTKQIRDVAVEDVLGRVPVRLDVEQIRSKLQNAVILVTGAAGSIGSELCRQIARFQPRAIVGFEIGEGALFWLDREMRVSFPNVSFCPEIGSVQNAQRLSEVFSKYSPSIVYHAAAYKHVPMMELHPFEAIQNNVFGTYEVAVAAARHGPETLS